MPRPRRARAEKAPAEPVVYELSSDVETVMSRVIRLHAEHFRWTHNFRVAGVMVRGGKPKDEGGCVILARFVKTPPLWHGLTGYDAVIRVEDWAWARLDASGQEALVVHELCHGSMSDKGTLRVLKHDLDEFGFVVRQYGAWRDAIAIFDKQLELFAPGFGRQEPGEQTVVPFPPKRFVVDGDGDLQPNGDQVGKVLDEAVERINAGELGPDVTARRGGTPKGDGAQPPAVH